MPLVASLRFHRVLGPGRRRPQSPAAVLSAAGLLATKDWAGVRNRRRGFTRISAKHQATLPVQALKEAGLGPGNEVRVTAVGRGRLVLERDTNVVERHAGALRGVYERGELDRLHGEWR